VITPIRSIGREVIKVGYLCGDQEVGDISLPGEYLCGTAFPTGVDI
jgi:hypothetical protein